MDTNHSTATVCAVKFGFHDEVFGLHVSLAFSATQVSHYSLCDMGEIRELMESFRAKSTEDLIGKKMRTRRYPVPLKEQANVSF